MPRTAVKAHKEESVVEKVRKRREEKVCRRGKRR